MRILILLLLLATSDGFSTSIVPARHIRQAPALQLNYFPSLPKAIDGCAGTYTYDSVSLKKKKYIFADNLQDQAFIHIGGKEIAMKRVSHSELEGGKAYKDIYTGQGYTVTVILKDIKSTGDEVSYEEGTLEVKKGQLVLKLKIHGEAGC